MTEKTKGVLIKTTFTRKQLNCTYFRYHFKKNYGNLLWSVHGNKEVERSYFGDSAHNSSLVVDDLSSQCPFGEYNCKEQH